MTLLVPFDGSTLSTAALEKASEHAELTDEDVVAVTIVPDDGDYARERGWIQDHEQFDPDDDVRIEPVSYTHLTLPTIYSV